MVSKGGSFKMVSEDLKPESGFVSKFTAKKDHTISRNKDHIEIIKGEEQVKVPKIYLETLKTEKII